MCVTNAGPMGQAQPSIPFGNLLRSPLLFPPIARRALGESYGMLPDRKELGRAGQGGGLEQPNAAEASAGWVWSGKEKLALRTE